MGYDMYVVDDDGHSVGGEPGDTTYWRRNIFGGSHQADVFVQLGLGTWADKMLYDAAEQEGWPSRPEGVEYFYDEETDEQGYRGDPALIAEYEAAKTARVKDRRGSGPGIAVYKLCNSNDGWWVTAEECREFLDLWEKAGKPVVDDFGHGPYNDTIPFIQTAAKYSGFRVW